MSSNGARDRFHKTPAQLEADKAVARYRGLAMQDWTVKHIAGSLTRCGAITPANVDAIAADDVEAWRSALFPDGR
jgi:hypothetical protein